MFFVFESYSFTYYLRLWQLYELKPWVVCFILIFLVALAVEPRSQT